MTLPTCSSIGIPKLRIPRSLIAPTALRSASVVPQVIARCIRMHWRWPWSDFDAYRKLGLRELRREYGIRVLVVY